MKFGKKILLAVLLFTMVGLELSAVDNVNFNKEEPMGYENYWNCISRKLGRGISNVAFGALEVPLRIFQVQFEEGGIAALCWGSLNGVGYFVAREVIGVMDVLTCVGYFVAREVIGVMDVLTFFTPLPFTPNDPVNGVGWGYGPVFTPEWVLTPETDPYNTVYKKTNYQN